MDRFSIFKREAKNREESTAVIPKKKLPLFIICMLVFLAGLLFITGEGWFPPQLGLLFAFTTIILLIGFVKFGKKQ